jgi:hypothetical protein
MTALLPYHKPNNDSNLYRNLLTALSIWDIKDVNESATKANLLKNDSAVRQASTTTNNIII